MPITLVVLVPDHRGCPSALLPLKQMLIAETALRDATWHEFSYVERYCSNKSLEVIAQELCDSIENKVQCLECVEKIVLVGHSMGASLIRRAFLNASGYKVKEIKQGWAELVDRFVLMGAFGRGFNIREQPFRLRVWLQPVAGIASLFGFAKMRLAMLPGSDFISSLRIDWIRFNLSCNRPPTVVHVLGSHDVAVRPESVIDLEQFPTAVPISVPYATHENIATPGPHTTTALKRAFSNAPESNRKPEPAESASKVFFLMHGIRDSRRCFEAVARQLEFQCPGAKVLLPQYGYLSARGFLSTRYRNKFIPWFVDQYAEYLARNPHAEFFYAGHSNGTYILGEALRRIHNISFSRVYLAASVLPTNFEWNATIIDQKQVHFVRSDMGSEDWPVGVLCRTLNRLGIKSIGSGGFDEFEFGDRDHISYNRFNGGHGSMLEKSNVDSIACFLADGSRADLSLQEPKGESLLFSVFKRYGDILLPLVFTAVTGLLILVSWLPFIAPHIPFLSYGPSVAIAVAAVGWIIFGRF
jgi:pimeloyl-ACP methyl ester carboxylesterase